MEKQKKPMGFSGEILRYVGQKTGNLTGFYRMKKATAFLAFLKKAEKADNDNDNDNDNGNGNDNDNEYEYGNEEEDRTAALPRYDPFASSASSPREKNFFEILRQSETNCDGILGVDMV